MAIGGGDERRSGAIAIGFSLAAAFGWATYYPLVLAVSPGTSSSAIIVLPFAFGGLAYAVVAFAEGHGAELGRIWFDPEAYVRTALILGTQLAILASTYLTGPVDASLLALIGDVVVTPIVAASLLGRYRRNLGTPLFGLGLLLSLAGGALAILAGGRLGAVPRAGWLAVVFMPIAVGFYFVLSARAGERRAYSAIVAQSMIAAAIGGVVLAPLLPGGLAGIGHVASWPLGVLVVTGLTSFCLAPLLYFRAIERVGLVFPPMLMTGIPFFTLLLSAVFLGQVPPPLAILGVPVAAAGGVVAVHAYRRGAASPGTPRGSSGG